MDRCIILGAYGFLGFGLCKAMLDKGLRVEALSLGIEAADRFTEEKRLEIGRNANFFENSVEQSINDRKYDQGITPIIIPIYDLFIKKSEMVLLENDFLTRIHQLAPEPFSITLLLPDQLAYEQSVKDGPISQLKENLAENKLTYQEIYLPTLFGPWQPEEFFFQQLMFPQKQTGDLLQLNARESLMDAVYIEDAAISVLQLLEKVEGKHLIRSGNPNSWLEGVKWICAESSASESAQLTGDKSLKWQQKSEVKPVMNRNLHTVLVKNSVDIRTGINKQRMQYERWLQSSI